MKKMLYNSFDYVRYLPKKLRGYYVVFLFLILVIYHLIKGIFSKESRLTLKDTCRIIQSGYPKDYSMYKAIKTFIYRTIHNFQQQK